MTSKSFSSLNQNLLKLVENSRVCTPESVEALLDEGANIHVKRKDGCNVLHLAAWNRDIPVIRLLIERGIELDAVTREGRTALMHAMAAPGSIQPESASCEIVETLIMAGANTSIAENTGQTIFDYAAHNKYLMGIIEEAISRRERNQLRLASPESSPEESEEAPSPLIL